MSGIPVVGSLGDILKVLELANELRHVVGSAARASAELREFQEDLDLFARGLQAVQHSLSCSAEAAGLGNSLTIQRDVEHAVSVCLNLLTRMQRRIQAHKDGITGQFGKKAWRKYWARLAWGILGGRTEVLDLRRRLMQQMAVLQLCLTARNSVEQCNGYRNTLSLTVQRNVSPLQVPPTWDSGICFFADDGQAVQPAAIFPYDDFSRFLAGYWSIKELRTSRLIFSGPQYMQMERIDMCDSLLGSTWCAYVIRPGVHPAAAPVVLLSPVFFRSHGPPTLAEKGASMKCTRLLISSLESIMRAVDATQDECLRILHASRLFLGGEQLIDIGSFARQVQQRASVVDLQLFLPHRVPPTAHAPGFARRIKDNATNPTAFELKAPPRSGLRPRPQRAVRRWVDDELAEFSNMQLGVAKRNQEISAVEGMRPSHSKPSSTEPDGFVFPTT
ncbi:hypothetical protein AURDEDRAFT_150479 [Auricularia subglabra TFB-10046 SS5]|nr:hypothetical protein AURDEDRAFT_150479 [Auricularia subglabra TFB-10046 SS5]